MKVRTIAGLIMLALAVALLAVFFLTYDRNAYLRGLAENLGLAEDAGVKGTGIQAAEIDSFLAAYNRDFALLRGHALRVGFASACEPSPASRLAAADTAFLLDLFTGNRKAVRDIRRLRETLALTEPQDRQLAQARRLAARRPATLPEPVLGVLDGAAAWADTLAALPYTLAAPGRAPRTVTLAELDGILAAATDPALRQAVWTARLGAGPHLKQALVDLVGPRNAAARELGFGSYSDLMAADLDLEASAWVSLLQELAARVRPLYEQIHCDRRHALARLYRQPVPDLIPVVWLDPGPAGLSAPDIRPRPAGRGGDALEPAREAAGLWGSLGAGPLDEGFWSRSCTAPGSAGGPRAVAWPIAPLTDIRLTVTGPVDALLRRDSQRAMATVMLHRSGAEAGLPPLLQGAPAALEAAFGQLMVLAAGLEESGSPEELLRAALQDAPVILPGATALARWQHDLYAGGMPRHKFNQAWWDYAAELRGIAPPEGRGEDKFDPTVLALLFADPAGEAHRALGLVIAHQMHRFICREILHTGVHEADYRNDRAVGDLLRTAMAQGRGRDWQVVLREMTGEDLSADAVVEYYAGLEDWLREQNRGRRVGF